MISTLFNTHGLQMVHEQYIKTKQVGYVVSRNMLMEVYVHSMIAQNIVKQLEKQIEILLLLSCFLKLMQVKGKVKRLLLKKTELL